MAHERQLDLVRTHNMHRFITLRAPHLKLEHLTKDALGEHDRPHEIDLCAFLKPTYALVRTEGGLLVGTFVQ
jgi:hypothetical protein